MSVLHQCWTASVCVLTQIVYGVSLFCTSVRQHLSVCWHKWFVVSVYSAPVLGSICPCVYTGGSWCLSEYFVLLLDSLCLCVYTNDLWCLSILLQSVFTQVVHGVGIFCSSVGQHCMSVCSLMSFMVSEWFAPVLDSICLCVCASGLWCLSVLHCQCWEHLSVCSLKWFAVSVCFVPVLDSICLCVHSNGLWCLSVLCQCWTASVCVFTQMVCGVCFVPVLDSICLCSLKWFVVSVLCRC